MGETATTPPQPQGGPQIKKVLKTFNPIAWATGSFAAGVAVILPFAVTVAILWGIVNFIDKAIVPLVLPLFPPDYQGIAKSLPGFGAIVAIVGLTIAGALTANFIGRFIVRTTRFVFEKAPIVRSVYGSVKQIFETMANPSGQSFKDAVLVEFPGLGQWSIAFITNDDCGEIETLSEDDVVAVYVPSSPIPTSGFLIYVAKSKLKRLKKGPEEALKLVMSAGIVKEKETIEG
jgi:uncharacterized membrane protein